MVGAIAAVLALTAILLITVASTAAGSDTARAHRARVDSFRAHVRTTARIAQQHALAHTPRSRGARCTRTTVVPGQGASCRTPDGLYLVPTAHGAPLVTHGPDIVAATTSAARAGGGFGSTASIVCSSSARARSVLLAYLVPADHAALRGDRYDTVADQMRQALYDAAALVDRRAGALAPGSRRRLRVRCDDDGRPTVAHVVLPRTQVQYRAAGAGFSALAGDLQRAGWLPTYAGYATTHLPAVQRVLGYYDADFTEGLAGQGTMYRRSQLLRTGFEPSDPLLSRTTRNINNNPPQAPIAIQYGTAVAGTPDPPLYTSMLHELAHTMGAVQDEPPTASDAGHCTDGLDLMCYDDAGPAGTYVDTVCPDPIAPLEPADEQFDCNGDTYFHPAPPAGNPLASATTWQLGLTANEAFAAWTGSIAAPAAVTSLQVAGTGTRRTLAWPAVAPTSGRSYEVAWRRVGTVAWSRSVTPATYASPSLAPATEYEFAVAAMSPRAVLGAAAHATVRTGIDTTPPDRPSAPTRTGASRTSLRLGYRLVSDNVRVAYYLLERLDGTAWTTVQTIFAPSGTPAAGTRAATPALTGLRPATTYRFRVRARDARGNVSTPSPMLTAATTR